MKGAYQAERDLKLIYGNSWGYSGVIRELKDGASVLKQLWIEVTDSKGSQEV